MNAVDERTISAIEPQQRSRERVSIFLDGEFAMGVNVDVVAALKLAVGQRLTEERLQRIVREESLTRARDRAFLLLSYRPRTEKEIRDRLLRAGHAEDVVDEVVARLYALNYLDDQDFAARFIRAKQAERPLGRRAVAFELRRKGVDAETTAEAVATVDDETERASAVQAARSRVDRYVKLEPREGRRKLAAFLQRRGFAWDTIVGVLDDILPSSDTD